MALTAEERERIERLIAEARERYWQGQPSTTTGMHATSSLTDPLPPDGQRSCQMLPVADIVARLQARLEAMLAQRRAEAAAQGVACIDCWDTGRCPSGRTCSCAAGERLRAQELAVARRERAAAWERWERELDDALGLPPRLRGWTLDRLGESEPVRAVRRWLVRRNPDEGLVLAGPFGCGKTVTASALLRELVLRDACAHAERGEDPAGQDTALPLPPPPPDARRLGLFTTATGLLEALRPREDGRPDPSALTRFQAVRYLVIDDLGAERLTAWGADRLYEVLNGRYNAQLPVIVTTNLDLARLAARWNAQLGDESGDRLINRLIECCAVIRWPDSAPNLRLGRAE